MKKININKLLLYVSTLPYIYCIVKCVYHAIFGYSLEQELSSGKYGLEAIYWFIVNGWIINIVHFNFIGLVLVICFSYQIYYYISYRKSYLEVENKSRRINLRKILFCICMLCWIIYLIMGIHAFFFGCYEEVAGTTKIYGIDALKTTLVWNLYIFSIIPILPVTMIYVIIYLLVKFKEKRNKNNQNINKKVS